MKICNWIHVHDSGNKKEFEIFWWPKTTQIKNVIIADSGTTWESTTHESGVEMNRNGNAGDNSTNAGGDDMAVKYVGNIHVSKCKNKGKVVNELII